MNVLIITGIFPPDIGGPATYVPQIATALADRGHQITVVTLDGHLPPTPRHSPPATHYLIVRLPRQAFRPWRQLLTVLTIIRLGRGADVLFVNGLYLEAVLANLFLRKPLVQKVVADWAWERATNRGWVKDSFEDFQKQSYGLKVEALKMLRTWWTRRADKIIVPSHFLARRVARWGVREEKITVIYNAAAPLNSVQPAVIPFANFPPTSHLQFKVVTVGRLIPLKQVDHIIEAIAQCDGAGLVIVGDGPERGHLEELIRTRGLSDRVYFAGQRSATDTLALMAACDLFVLNSTHEGFPHVVLEAMSCGLPVVATTVGGIPEVVEDGRNGRLIPVASNGALQEVIALLGADTVERRRLATGARRTVERFSRDQMVEETAMCLKGAM